MHYCLIPLRPRKNLDYCFIDKHPEGLGLLSYKIGHGEPIGADYPADARVYMTDRYQGMQISDLIENARSMLITSRRVKEVLEKVHQGPAEYLPLSIYNHRKRLASADHFIINPLGTVDCLNLEASEIEYHNGKVVRVNNPVLDPAKIRNAPHLFRMRENSYSYLISEVMLQALRTIEPRPTNFVLDQLAQVPSHPSGAPPAAWGPLIKRRLRKHEASPKEHKNTAPCPRFSNHADRRFNRLRMNYYLILPMPRENLEYCFVDELPKGLGLNRYKVGHGELLGADYPADARVYMTDRYMGIQVSDLVENACGMLIVSKRVKEVFERVNDGPVEYLPVAIYNHKKRVASADHFIVNPVGNVDCLNLQASDIVYHEEEVVQVRRPVLDPAKLKYAPHLFRMREHTYSFLMSERMQQELGELDPVPTNFYFEELDQVPAKSTDTQPE
ncbi:imm11 family protein [Myxococcus sp. 1LA]